MHRSMLKLDTTAGVTSTQFLVIFISALRDSTALKNGNSCFSTDSSILHTDYSSPYLAENPRNHTLQSPENNKSRHCIPETLLLLVGARRRGSTMIN